MRRLPIPSSPSSFLLRRRGNNKNLIINVPPLLLTSLVYSSSSSSSLSSLKDRIREERQRLQQQQQETDELLSGKNNNELDDEVGNENEIGNDNIDEMDEAFIDDDDETTPKISFEHVDAMKVYSDREAVIQNLREKKAERQEKRAQFLVWQATQREKGFESRTRSKIAKQVGRKRAQASIAANRSIPVGNKVIHEPDNEDLEHLVMMMEKEKQERRREDDDESDRRDASRETRKSLNQRNLDRMPKSSSKRQAVDDEYLLAPSSSTSTSSFSNNIHQNQEHKKVFAGRNKDLFENEVEEVIPEENDDDDLFAGSDDYYFGASESQIQKDIAMKNAGKKHPFNQSRGRRGVYQSTSAGLITSDELYGKTSAGCKNYGV